jgi:hypothetical protein
MPVPNALCDHLLKKLNLRHDQELANYFDVHPPMISKVRNLTKEVSANFILLIHEKTGIPIAEIKDLINLAKRQKHENKKRDEYE